MAFQDEDRSMLRKAVQQIEAISDALFGSYDSTGLRQEQTPGLIKEVHDLQEYEAKEHVIHRLILAGLGVLVASGIGITIVVGK